MTEVLYKNQMLSAMDRHFAMFVGRLTNSDDPHVLLAAALVSNATGNKHVCLNLVHASETLQLAGHTGDATPNVAVEQWREKLLASSAVGLPGDCRPLILDERNRLYLYRYWQYETELANQIRRRLRTPAFDVNSERLCDSLNRYFPPDSGGADDSQRRAVITACYMPLCIITGGPGTGKTTSVATVLLTLQDQVPDCPYRILLAAPTGKAAAKLGERIREAMMRWIPSPRIADVLPPRPLTLHRLLKPISGPSAPFFYNRDRPLPADIVVIDEASMVDISMMTRIFGAIRENARLILVGDRHQLASVEAGSAFGDICGGAGVENKTASDNWHPAVDRIQKGPRRHLDGHLPGKRRKGDWVVELNTSFRFDGGRGVGQLSRAIAQGDVAQAREIFSDTAYPDIRFENYFSRPLLHEILERKIITGYTVYLNTPDIEKALENLNAFKILCAVKNGDLGVTGLNRTAESVLARAGLIDPSDEWYPGRPILITRNDYRLDLFNGDIGIVGEDGGGEPMVCFPSPEGGIRKIYPHRLPDHETAYAMTVHKSQGSEFDAVVLMLPDADTPLLTRELLYTAVSRARFNITVCGNPSLFTVAMERTIFRNSGLQDAVWK